ncbi:porin family protein [Shimia marina]|nr:hypothetical protein [Shimia marina]
MGHKTKTSRGLLLAVALSAATFAGASWAEDDHGFDYYGFFNLGFFSADDGATRTDYWADNSNAPSRFGARYHTPVTGGELQFKFESSFGIKPSDGVSQLSEPPNTYWDLTRLRKVEVIYRTDDFGTFYLGQGSMASDGITSDPDQSGTGLAGTVSVRDSFGGILFRESGGGLSSVDVGDVFQDFDGGRRGRVRYDTKSFNGLVFAIAAGQEILRDGNDDTFYDVALRYKKDTGDLLYGGNVAYAINDLAGGETKTIIGSLGAFHRPSGVSGTVSLGDNDGSGSYIYAKLGYQRDWLSFGRTHLSFDVYRSRDMVVSGDEGVAWGLQAVQKVESADLDIFAAYRNQAYDQPGMTFSDVDGYMMGARWSF